IFYFSMSFVCLNSIILFHLVLFLFSFNNSATTQIYTLSLHDALPISSQNYSVGKQKRMDRVLMDCMVLSDVVSVVLGVGAYIFRSEEHTSELQSRFDLVCRLLLEKKNKRYTAVSTRFLFCICSSFVEN